MFLPPVRPVAPVQVPAKRAAAPVFPVRQLFFVWKETKKNTTDVISLYSFFGVPGLKTILIDTPVAYTQAQELMCAERVMDIQDSLPEIVFYEDHLPLCAYLSAYKKEELLRHIHPHIRFFSSMTVNIRPSIFKH